LTCRPLHDFPAWFEVIPYSFPYYCYCFSSIACRSYRTVDTLTYFPRFMFICTLIHSMCMSPFTIIRYRSHHLGYWGPSAPIHLLSRPRETHCKYYDYNYDYSYSCNAATILICILFILLIHPILSYMFYLIQLYPILSYRIL
jgi:hypothetical protein